jgi:ABC-2 type transport system permease protein
VIAPTLAALLAHAWARHRVVLACVVAAIAAFEFILTELAPAPNEVSWVSAIITTLPPSIRALAGNDVALSPAGFLALGYAHPFFMILLSVWVVRVSSAGVAGEIGRGTMDLLASRPVPRWHFVAAGFACLVFGLALILVTAWTATAAGLRLRPLNTTATAFVPVVLSAGLLFAAWGGVGLAISATRRDGGQAITWITAVLAASFVLDYLARLWAPIAWMRPLSLFRYYEPQAILASGLAPAAVVVLVATTLAALAVAVSAVVHRDL